MYDIDCLWIVNTALENKYVPPVQCLYTVTAELVLLRLCFA